MCVDRSSSITIWHDSRASVCFSWNGCFRRYKKPQVYAVYLLFCSSSAYNWFCVLGQLCLMFFCMPNGSDVIDRPVMSALRYVINLHIDKRSRNNFMASPIWYWLALSNVTEDNMRSVLFGFVISPSLPAKHVCVRLFFVRFFPFRFFLFAAEHMQFVQWNRHRFSLATVEFKYEIWRKKKFN